MKYSKTKYNTTSKKHKRVLTRLKAIKTKKDRMEFLRIYVMNKNNEYVKRCFGGDHRPSLGSSRHATKLKRYH